MTQTGLTRGKLVPSVGTQAKGSLSKTAASKRISAAKIFLEFEI
jgi:hypothetical protein